MSKILNQKIFRQAIVEQMRADLRSGKSLKTYFEEKFAVVEKDTLLSTISIQGKPPVLKTPKKDLVSADLENSITLHEFYKSLDETQASDPRLWAYLSHVEFRNYSLARWGIEGEYKDLKTDEDKQRAINQLLEHWFVSSNDRDLRRHSIARLWWAAHLTYAPWERDPEFFGDLKNKDPYLFTRILLFTQDIYQQVLERAMGRSNRVLITVLEYLGENKKFAQSREKIRNLMKELNLIFGTKKIISLSREGLRKLVKETAVEIDKDNPDISNKPTSAGNFEKSLSKMTSLEGLKLPESVSGNLNLYHLTSIQGLRLPKMIGGYLNLCSLRSADGLELPESVGGNLNLFNLRSAKGLRFPKSVGGDLILYLLASIDGLNLPETVGGSIRFLSLKSAKGLRFPKSVGGNIELNCLTTAEGLILPEFVGGEVELNSIALPEKDKLKKKRPDLRIF